eukprot:COSAG03_NODE_7271_length_941_cov_1.460808_1_plen_182_part_01
MRRWIQDTPRNRARLQKLIVKPKIRNPRTGRLILATPHNIRATEAYRLERVQQMIQNRAARLIVSKINQFRTRNQFTFNETSENFQTAEIRGSRLDTRAFNAFIAKIPQRYRSVRFFVDFLTLEGEEFVTSSKQIVDLPDNYTGDDIIEKTSAISLLYNDDSKPVSSRAATIAGFHFQFDQL